ncbi:MAG: ferritin family protein [Deltaproteobacteria bacterium]|nr:ferritin family protein [Deltaproteobacteria bacterium]
MAANVKTGETILEAIKAEMEGREFYLAAAQKVKNPLVRRRLLGLAEDELEHRKTLSRLYWAQTGIEPGDVMSGNRETVVPDMVEMSMESILQLAMKNEKDAAERYDEMAHKADDARSKGFLEYLADMELGHYEILSRELDLIKSRPGWENQEIEK